jgi:hypothetical protein
MYFWTHKNYNTLQFPHVFLNTQKLQHLLHEYKFIHKIPPSSSQNHQTLKNNQAMDFLVLNHPSTHKKYKKTQFSNFNFTFFFFFIIVLNFTCLNHQINNSIYTNPNKFTLSITQVWPNLTLYLHICSSSFPNLNFTLSTLY